jgi:EAL domain-containing protein (putative c-di-GMP-specific phosphodiesterase class I)/GGDEF domain-containing protein
LQQEGIGTVKAQAQRWFSRVAAAAALALLTELARRLSSDPSSTALCWPAAGLGAVFLARWGWRGAWPLLGGLTLWAVLVPELAWAQVPWLVAAGAVGPLTLKALLRQRWRLRRGTPNPFELSRSLGAVVATQALVAAPLAAFLAAVGLSLAGRVGSAVALSELIALHWVLELSGFLLLAPLSWELMAMRSGPRAMLAEVLRQGRRHAGTVLVLIGLVLAASALWLWPGAGPAALAATYLLAPLLALSLAGIQPLAAFTTLSLAGGLLLSAQTFGAQQAAPDKPLLVTLFLCVTLSAVLAMRALLNEQRQARRQLEQQAFVDHATGLLNRAGLNRLLEGWSAQFGGRDRALLSLRAGNLDAIEALGGPQRLAELDRLLAEELQRELPHVRWARLTTLRFVGAVAQLSDPQGDLALLERIAAGANARLRDALHAPLWGVAGLRISSSLPCNTGTLYAALRELEHRALAGRRSLWGEADAVTQQQLASDAAQGQALRARLEARQVAVLAQTIQHNTPGGMAGLKIEVLCRLPEADGSLLAPATFLPVAVRHGLMPLLDLVVIEQTLVWFAAHPKAFAALGCCGLNLSGASLTDPGTPERLATLFRRYALSPSKFAIEVTENQAIAQLAQGMENLQALRGLGCRIALDDFGTGLATFDYLKRFPVDSVKIDGSFVRNLEHSAVDRAIVEAIVRVARTLGVRTVAEFVETPRLARLVSEIGVDESQGYALGLPQRLELVFAEALDGELVLSSIPAGGSDWALASA